MESTYIDLCDMSTEKPPDPPGGCAHGYYQGWPKVEGSLYAERTDRKGCPRRCFDLNFSVAVLMLNRMGRDTLIYPCFCQNEMNYTVDPDGWPLKFYYILTRVDWCNGTDRHIVNEHLTTVTPRPDDVWCVDGWLYGKGICERETLEVMLTIDHCVTFCGQGGYNGAIWYYAGRSLLSGVTLAREYRGSLTRFYRSPIALAGTKCCPFRLNTLRSGSPISPPSSTCAAQKRSHDILRL